MPKKHVSHVLERKEMDKTPVILKIIESMRIARSDLYLAFHKEHDVSIWRSGSPCLHHWSSSSVCPLGSSCGFPSLEQTICFHHEHDVLEEYKELERKVDSVKQRIADRKKADSEVNEKVMKLPLEKFLVQYKITLKRELCRNGYCYPREECDKAHSMRELFIQFDQPFLKEFYSYQFSQVKPILPRKSNHNTKIEFSCHKCKSLQFQDHALLLLVSIQGTLIEPRVARTCLYCGVETHFLVYFRD